MLFVWEAREMEKARKLGDDRKKGRVALAKGRYDMSPAPLSLAAPTDLRKAAQFLLFDPL